MRIQQFDFSVDLLRALLWHYNDAPLLQSLLQSKSDWYERVQNEFWTNWVKDVFDLRTANDFGLAVWAIILDMPLTVDVGADAPGKINFGFGSFHNNFDNGNFTRGSGQGTRLSTEQKRIVLRLRYFQLVTRGAIPEINRFLQILFPGTVLSSGSDYVLPGYVDPSYVSGGSITVKPFVYALDGLDMTMEYVFTSAPSSELQFVLQQYDLLPRPAAVKVTYRVSTRKAFGFGPLRLNFDNGTYGA